jgi:Immunity protein 63
LITLEELRIQVDALARKIGAPVEFLPLFGMSNHDGTPHIEINRDTYYFMAYERDTVTINRQTTRLPRLMYWIFETITDRMGFAYANEHRDPKNDPRRLIFQKQMELLEKLRVQWKDLKEQEINEILERHPYRDEVIP